ncbi:MAG: RecX family transcriptional regulator [Prevotellaceae bacterium]|jgi:regulatory protein|nr:RecX family transcriptional regulator [Prevotellaceae bacterium]
MNEVLQNMETWCSTKEVCVSEAKIKMRKWNVPEADSDKIIALLIESGYINEERYAKAFANDKLILSKWGPQKVRQILKQRGIKETLISKAIAEKNTDQEATILDVLSKRIKSFKQLSNEEIYAKLMRFGLSRGFDYSLLTKCTQKLLKIEN